MIIFGAPARYVQGAGALSWLGRELAAIGGSAVLVADPVIQARHGSQIARSCVAADVRLSVLSFGGECTDKEVVRLADMASGPDVIAAAGGGKCLDAGKALAHQLRLPMVSIPTAASTDAPISHIYVMYDDAHRLHEVRRMPRSPALVVVDTEVIAQAPRNLFSAGIGDAIGKIYEVEACVSAHGRNIFSGRSAQSALALARASHAILWNFAENALAAIERRQVTDALENVIEATILMSGIAFESGGLSLAHSLTRGLSSVSKYARTLHGFQVAYANLVQIRLEGRPESEFRALADFYARSGLPRSLMELGGQPTRDDIHVIASGTMTSPHIGNFPSHLNADRIVDAMVGLESANLSA